MWVSPFARARARRRCSSAPGATARTARAPTGSTPRPTDAWDLDALRAAYDGWLANADGLVAAHLEAHDDADEAAFAARFHLVHEWRKFLFADPGLPERAAAPRLAGPAPRPSCSTSEATRLKPGADRFVARCLDDGRSAVLTDCGP